MSWQLTRDCDLCCVHCCTESAPGNKLPDELNEEAALRIADEVIRAEVPYVMLCGGEPLLAPSFFSIAERLGRNGVQIKIETNGQRFGPALATRLARLPIRSIQVSLDADSPELYRRQRSGGELERAHAACRSIRAAGLPLEVTFAPTRLNLEEIEAVLERARSFGAFRFNTGKLMRIGTAARRWRHLEPNAEQYRLFVARLRRYAADHDDMQLFFEPFSVQDGLRLALEQAPATLLVLPNGAVKVAAALPYLCADLRRQSLTEAWTAYRRAWHDERILDAVRRAIENDSSHNTANAWRAI